MSWLVRVLVRRSFVQVPILAGVTALAVAACTLLGSVAILVTSLNGPVTGALLAQADPGDTALEATLVPRATDADSDTNSDDSDATSPATIAVDGTLRAFDSMADGVPLSVSAWRSSEIYRLTSDRDAPGTYLAAPPDDLPMQIVEGTAPADGDLPTSSAHDPLVPVAVPRVLAEARDWQVGDRKTLDPARSGDPVRIEVVALYEPGPPRDAWATDRLAGQMYDPEFFLTAGSTWIELHGPLITSPQAIDVAGVPLSEVRVSAVPDLAGLTSQEAAALRDRSDLGQGLVTREVGEAADPEFFTALDRVVDQVAARVAVTRAVVLMSGLVLLVIAAAALRLVARFLAEHRADGLELLDARGASRAQLIRLTTLEAAAVAALVTLVSPWLAAGLLTSVTRILLRDDGGGAAAVHVDPAGPALWATCAATAVVLAGLLVVPVVRAESGRDEGADTHRPGRAAALRGALLRSGGTVMLAVLAGVAAWQLASYRTPASGGGTDPVVVLAPALLLLATALVITRCLPLLGRVTDRLAARSRHLTVPLAAWETGRRPARASGTVLLLTLTISVAVAVPSTIATWRTSQADQAELAVGTPARLTDVSGAALDASARIADATGRLPDTFRPVTDRQEALLGEQGRGRSFRVLGVDDADLLRGRVVDGQGPDGTVETWPEVGDLLVGDPARTGPDGDPDGVRIPAGSERIEAWTDASIEITVDPDRAIDTPPGDRSDGETGTAPRTEDIDGVVRVDLVLQDARGVREQRTLNAHKVSMGELSGNVPLRDDDTSVDEPLWLVGMTATVRELDSDLVARGITSARVRVAVADLQVVDGSGDVTPLEFGSWQARDIPAVPATDPDEDSFLSSPGPVPAPSQGGSIAVDHDLPAQLFLQFGSQFALAPDPAGDATFPGTTASDALAPVPAVVTTGLADQERVAIGDTLQLDGSAPIPLVVTGTVRHLPGGTGEGILVRHDALRAAQFAAGNPLAAPDEWWGEVADADVGPLTEALDGTGDLRTVVTERATALSGPLQVTVPVALGLLAAAAVLLAGAGVAAGTMSGLRSRRLEIARLQALGVPRRLLSRAVLAEYGLLGAVSLVGGAIAGTVLTLGLAPATAVGPGGGPPVPEASTVIPWSWLFALGGATAVVVALVVATTVRVQVRRASADLLRLGADR